MLNLQPNLKVPKGEESVQLMIEIAKDAQGFEKRLKVWTDTVAKYEELVGAYDSKAKADQYMNEAKLKNQQAEEALAHAQNQAQATVAAKVREWETLQAQKEREYQIRVKTLEELQTKNRKQEQALADRETSLDIRDRHVAKQQTFLKEWETELATREQTLKAQIEALGKIGK